MYRGYGFIHVESNNKFYYKPDKYLYFVPEAGNTRAEISHKHISLIILGACTHTHTHTVYACDKVTN